MAKKQNKKKGRKKSVRKIPVATKTGMQKARKAVKKKAKKKKVINRYPQLRSLLWRNRRDYYDSYYDKDLLLITSRIYRDIKQNPAIWRNKKLLVQLHDQYSHEEPEIPTKQDFPEIPLYNLERKEYFYVKDFASIITIFPDFAYIKSGLDKDGDGNDISQGGNIISNNNEIKVSEYTQCSPSDLDRLYQKYFKDWVNWCNEVHRRTRTNETDKIFIFFRFGQRFYDEKSGKWIIPLLSCDGNDNPNDYGYTARKFKGEEKAEPEKPEPEKPEPDTKEKKMARLEKQNEILLAQKRDKLEEMKVLKEIEDKEGLDDAKKELKEINKELKQLREDMKALK